MYVHIATIYHVRCFILYFLDINECESEDFSCSINKFCSNTPGGYECLSCRNGFGVSHDQLRCILSKTCFHT